MLRYHRVDPGSYPRFASRGTDAPKDWFETAQLKQICDLAVAGQHIDTFSVVWDPRVFDLAIAILTESNQGIQALRAEKVMLEHAAGEMVPPDLLARLWAVESLENGRFLDIAWELIRVHHPRLKFNTTAFARGVALINNPAKWRVLTMLIVNYGCVSFRIPEEREG